MFYFYSLFTKYGRYNRGGTAVLYASGSRKLVLALEMNCLPGAGGSPRSADRAERLTFSGDHPPSNLTPMRN